MITPISALSTVQMPQRPMHSSGLTPEQNKKLENTLSNFDPQNLSDDDARALVIEIKELGITSGRDLHDALAKSGIDARELANQAGISVTNGPPKTFGESRDAMAAPMAGPPPPSNRVDETALKLLQETLQSYSEGDTQESFAEVLATKLTENGYDPSKPVVDIYS